MQNLPQDLVLNEILPKLSASERSRFTQTNKKFHEMDRLYLKQNIGMFAAITPAQLRDILKTLSGKEVIQFCNSNSILKNRCEKDRKLWQLLLERDFPMWNAILLKNKKLPFTYQIILASPILRATETQEIFLELINLPRESWKLGEITAKSVEIIIPSSGDWNLFTNIRNRYSAFLEQYLSKGGIVLNILKN